MPTQRLHAWLDVGTPVPGPPGLPRVIYDEGTELPVRTIIDMRGAGVTATDDPVGDKTVITIPGGTADMVVSVFGRPGPAITAQAGDYNWSQITSKPVVFPPEAHQHPWGDITGKPSSFPPSAHTHPWGEITGIPSNVSSAVPDTRQIIAGTGLTGGGALSGNVTLSANIAGIQTPWAQPVSAAGFALSNAPLFQSAADMVFGVGAGSPERMRISAATGSVRISAGMEVNTGQSYLGNLTYDGSNWRYISTGSAFAINCVSGSSTFFTAPNGTAGAVAALTSRTSWDTDGWTRFSAANVSVSTAGDTALEVKTTGSIQTAYLRLVTQQGGSSNEWDIVAAGAGLAGPVLRFAHGSPFAGPVLELGDSAIKMWLGGSLKTLSVDGSGFVKAT